MAKKVKSFTVNEEAYNRLISMFKKYKAETSISEFLNNELERLLIFFEDIEKGIEEMNYSIPMQFVIDDAVRCSKKSNHLSSEPEENGDLSSLEKNIQYIEECYEADQKGIPREFYRWLRDNDNFKLSEDKKFIIDKKQGLKFVVSNRGSLLSVSEIDNNKK